MRWRHGGRDVPLCHGAGITRQLCGLVRLENAHDGACVSEADNRNVTRRLPRAWLRLLDQQQAAFLINFDAAHAGPERFAGIIEIFNALRCECDLLDSEFVAEAFTTTARPALTSSTIERGKLNLVSLPP